MKKINKAVVINDNLKGIHRRIEKCSLVFTHFEMRSDYKNLLYHADV